MINASEIADELLGALTKGKHIGAALEQLPNHVWRPLHKRFEAVLAKHLAGTESSNWKIAFYVEGGDDVYAMDSELPFIPQVGMTIDPTPGTGGDMMHVDEVFWSVAQQEMFCWFKPVDYEEEYMRRLGWIPQEEYEKAKIKLQPGQQKEKP